MYRISGENENDEKVNNEKECSFSTTIERRCKRFNTEGGEENGKKAENWCKTIKRILKR